MTTTIKPNSTLNESTIQNLKDIFPMHFSIVRITMPMPIEEDEFQDTSHGQFNTFDMGTFKSMEDKMLLLEQFEPLELDGCPIFNLWQRSDAETDGVGPTDVTYILVGGENMFDAQRKALMVAIFYCSLFYDHDDFTGTRN